LKNLLQGETFHKATQIPVAKSKIYNPGRGIKDKIIGQFILLRKTS